MLTHFIKAWALFLVLWLSLQSASCAAAIPDDAKALHVANRLGFGPRPGLLDQVKAMGVDRYIQQQLSPETIPLPPALSHRLASLETLRMGPRQLQADYAPRRSDIRASRNNPQELKALYNQASVVVTQAVEGRLLQSIESPRQLEEALVDFWYNHFNVSIHKGLARYWVGAYEAQAIRPHVLGKFRDLLGATAHHPAMQYYLDNWSSTSPNSPGVRGAFKGINENYARELMELHTLGVDGGYTQADVIALAKILTGWGFCGVSSRTTSQRPDNFCFAAQRHDPTDKVFLGQTIQAGGEEEGETALDMLARHPSTAKFISYKLAQYFVADQPPQALVDRMAQRFQATDGDLRAVMETLTQSPEFWDKATINAKFKTPYQFVVSLIRASGFELTSFRGVRLQLTPLGMPLYGCETPDGYKNTQVEWLSPDAMVRRLSYATAVAKGNVYPRSPATATTPPPQVSPVDPQQLIRTLGNTLSEQTQQAIAASPDTLRAAVILGSPEFMYR